MADDTRMPPKRSAAGAERSAVTGEASGCGVGGGGVGFETGAVFVSGWAR
jgi:hypothetical protein